MPQLGSPTTPVPAAAPSRGGAGLARLVTSDGRPVCDRCELADSFSTRLMGLMGRGALPAGGGLLLRPAGSIHTCFMRFPIDVVFLDRHLRVVHVAHGVRPWRVAGARGGRAVLELPAGEARRVGIEAGDTLYLEGGKGPA